MKKRSGKNLIQWFYHFLVVLFMAMPLLSTLVRCLYVQFNSNAFENYSGTNEVNIEYRYESNEVNSVDDLIVGNIYEFEVASTLHSSISNQTSVFYGTKMWLYFYSNNNEKYVSYYDNFILYRASSSAYGVRLRGDDVNSLSVGNLSNWSLKGRFVVSNATLENTTYFSYFTFGICDYNEIENIDIVQDTLDNAFDYSIKKTYNEYKDTTLVDFTGFFNNVFIDYTDNLYMNFATWYIGWVLSCAIISFVPYVLLSFYHICIHVIDRFTRKDY